MTNQININVNALMTGIPGMYDFRDVGNGDVMLRYCRPDGEFGSCQIVDYCDLEKNVLALESMGWVRACGVPAWSLRSAA